MLYQSIKNNILGIANHGGDVDMEEKKQGLNSIDIPLYGDNVKPGFIPFYEVTADLIEMENIKPPPKIRPKT